jgi:hypothetical protein
MYRVGLAQRETLEGSPVSKVCPEPRTIARLGGTKMGTVFDPAYPDERNPSEVFGGRTWTRTRDRLL